MSRTPSMLLALTVLGLPCPARDRAMEQALARVDEVIAEGPFKSYWQSLQAFQVPDWYLDAKLGIFIHWGVDSVPAYDDWYFGHMYEKGHKVYLHHLEAYGPLNKFGYKDFIPGLTFEKYDAAQYAALFKSAGARFVVPVGDHHDGFPLYDCYTMWTAARKGPKRDIVFELEAAARKQGMHFGISSHRAENWWVYHAGTEVDSDVRDPRFAGLYGPAKPRTVPPSQEFLEDWLARSTEIVDKFKPDLVWAVQWKRGVVINYKYRSFVEGTAVLDLERGQLNSIRPMVWQNDTSVSKNSRFHVSGPDYRTPDSPVADLVDIVSKNGVLLLNVGPRSDGSIPDQEQATLRSIGKWQAVNGDAIYQTRTVYGVRHPVHRQARDFVRDCPRMAGRPPGHHQDAGSRSIAGNTGSKAARVGFRPELEASRVGPSRRVPTKKTLRIRLRPRGDLRKVRQHAQD
jgi:alpha-L-fucosidase